MIVKINVQFELKINIIDGHSTIFKLNNYDYFLTKQLDNKNLNLSNILDYK